MYLQHSAGYRKLQDGIKQGSGESTSYKLSVGYLDENLSLIYGSVGLDVRWELGVQISLEGFFI